MAAGILTRKELARELGIPEHRLHYSPSAPRLNRKMRHRLARLAGRKTK